MSRSSRVRERLQDRLLPWRHLTPGLLAHQPTPATEFRPTSGSDADRLGPGTTRNAYRASRLECSSVCRGLLGSNGLCGRFLPATPHGAVRSKGRAQAASTSLRLFLRGHPETAPNITAASTAPAITSERRPAPSMTTHQSYLSPTHKLLSSGNVPRHQASRDRHVRGELDGPAPSQMPHWRSRKRAGSGGLPALRVRLCSGRAFITLLLLACASAGQVLGSGLD